ncbi:hypothetical protein EVAR_65312_1 [Eumeta japonica]|uniref:Uncharacterized protein n=1 Tax=Eumeta variegata TaxID=151549 RepID=A0A4C1YV14_EUMVA|nr:hypothetical protein EVAR_65312_1 [Eumeta japonica]
MYFKGNLMSLVRLSGYLNHLPRRRYGQVIVVLEYDDQWYSLTAYVLFRVLILMSIPLTLLILILIPYSVSNPIPFSISAPALVLDPAHALDFNPDPTLGIEPDPVLNFGPGPGSRSRSRS